MTEKRFKFRRFDVDIANINEIALYEIDNNPSDDLDESNLFYVYSTTDANVQDIVDKLNSQEERIRELKTENKQLIKEWFESEKDYIVESYHDNAIRRDEKLQFLKEEFKARFGDVDD